ncbi:hypothetical protein [Metabacillus arenae]|uniref:Small peptidoglycan-associated lipoprotein n=1 Tax=Metabacillus arenae TaxID=2771434 RepID=A0A926NN70_9BACI|nr:hypothetical protein [Metabacillus arenae]MBD1380901.1 hypothetical protein [Metabacillus arenae]
MARSIKFFSLLIPLFILSACSPTQLFANDHSLKGLKDRQILFYSDVQNMDKEAVYYDALLELKKEYPSEVKNMKVYQTQQEGPFDIDTYPSLIIVENNEIVIHIKGNVMDKEEITDPVLKVLSQ